MNSKYIWAYDSQFKRGTRAYSPTEPSETNSVKYVIATEADTLRQQRDELLQALRLLVGDMDKYLYPEEAIDTYTTKHEGKLRELLAKYTEDAK